MSIFEFEENIPIHAETPSWGAETTGNKSSVEKVGFQVVISASQERKESKTQSGLAQTKNLSESFSCIDPKNEELLCRQDQTPNISFDDTADHPAGGSEQEVVNEIAEYKDHDMVSDVNTDLMALESQKLSHDLAMLALDSAEFKIKTLIGSVLSSEVPVNLENIEKTEALNERIYGRYQTHDSFDSATLQTAAFNPRPIGASSDNMMLYTKPPTGQHYPPYSPPGSFPLPFFTRRHHYIAFVGHCTPNCPSTWHLQADKTVYSTLSLLDSINLSRKMLGSYTEALENETVAGEDNNIESVIEQIKQMMKSPTFNRSNLRTLEKFISEAAKSSEQ
ncbi:unnamed protein product [Mesocestoides corti]|uniref:Pecanex-like protein n=1 Tax=Mesocestoides corti TaxID=53468 RepID=A0A0R3U3E6_MESCO|nr:unnamed protein product [Mesocestoides corti]